MLLYLADVDGSLITALNIISKFDVYSGFKVNWNKSTVFSFDPMFTSRMPLDFPLQVVPKFRYLGIEIQLPLSTYISNNISTLITRQIISRLGPSCLSISQAKSTYSKWYTFPDFYIYSDMPRFISTKKMFIEINILLWGSKPPRISLDTLHLPIQAGGLALPNLQCYYLASQLTGSLVVLSKPRDCLCHYSSRFGSLLWGID